MFFCLSQLLQIRDIKKNIGTLDQLSCKTFAAHPSFENRIVLETIIFDLMQTRVGNCEENLGHHDGSWQDKHISCTLSPQMIYYFQASQYCLF